MRWDCVVELKSTFHVAVEADAASEAQEKAMAAAGASTPSSVEVNIEIEQGVR